MKLIGKCLVVLLLITFHAAHQLTIFANENGWSFTTTTENTHKIDADSIFGLIHNNSILDFDEFFNSQLLSRPAASEQSLQANSENNIHWWENEITNSIEPKQTSQEINEEKFLSTEENSFNETNANLNFLNYSEDYYDLDLEKMSQLNYSVSERYYNAHFSIKNTGESGRLTVVSADSAIYNDAIVKSGPICSLSNSQNIKSKCNSIPVIALVERISQSVTAYQDINAVAVIFKEDNVNYSLALRNPDIPSFSVSSSNFQLLMQMDLYGNPNQFITLFYDPSTNFGWLTTLMLCLAGLTIVLLLVWIFYIHWYASAFYIQLQRYYNILPYLLGLIAFGIYLEVDSSVGGENSTNWLGVLGLMTKLITKLSLIVYKTFFWILLILVSYGYLTFNFVNRNSFFFIFTIVYLGFLSEIVINNIFMMKDVWDTVSVTFIKSSIFYIGYSILCIRKSVNLLSKINVEYLNMIIDDNNLVENILLKVFMIKTNLAVVISYATLYICGGFALSLVYKNSDNPVILVYFFILDLISLIVLLFCLRPRELLFRYDGTNIEFEEYSHIYRATISTKKLQNFYVQEENEMVSLSMNSNEAKEACSDEKIIILNPLYAGICEDKSRITLIDNTVSFKKLQIDFPEVENNLNKSIVDYNLLDSILLGTIAKS